MRVEKDGDLFLYIKLLGVAVCWGGTFVAGRLLAREVPPFTAAFLRFAVACCVLGLILWWRRGGLPGLGRRQFGVVALLGLTGVFAYNALFFSGLRTVPAARAALIIASNPVLIALASALFLGESLRWLNGVGIAVSLAGAGIIISRGAPLQLWVGGVQPGEGFILGCVVSWTAYTLIGKVALRGVSPLVAVTYACGVGTVLLFPAALWEGAGANLLDYSGTAWWGIAYLGVFGSALAFVWYYQGVAQVGAARAAVFINFVPVAAVVLAFLLLGEVPDASLGLGAVLVCGGVYLTNRGRRSRGVALRADGSGRG